MPENYVIYHLHSMLSNGTTNIDSITNFRDYVKAASECGMTALGLAEHGNTFEWLHKKEAIEAAGMKYLHGVEAYLTEELYRENESGEQKPVRDNYHCVLIARNYDGVKELNKLVSKSFNRQDGHFYYVPRITFDELFATSDNILVTTACLGGVLHNGNDSAREKYLGFLAKNQHRCWLEIQHHNCQDQIEYNKFLLSLSQQIGVPLITGTDTHALNDEHMAGRAVMQKAKGVHFSDEDEWDLTFKTPEQLIRAYERQGSLSMDVVRKAMAETIRLADMVEEFKLDYSPKYPKLYADSEAVFKQKVNEGVVKRGINKKPNRKEYYDRIHYEYDTYVHNKAIDFMLLEEAYKSEMRRQGVRFGYSRGSVSGSIIAYLLGITEIDSVKYKLNYERFMNRERVSLADIDTDWFSNDRDTVRQYLYGRDGLYCCDIVTFNTIALKGAIKDVCRGLYKDDSSLNYMDLADEIIEIAEADEEKARKKYPKVFRYVDMVRGVVVSVGNHPSACVVSPYPVDEWFGTFTTSTDEYPISVINMKEIDSLNFVKLDILGLDNIGLIYKTCDAAGIPFATPDNIPPDDMDVWNSIREDTTMIFQWESQSATAYLKQLLSDATVAKIREKNPDASYMDLLSIGNGAIRPAGESYRDALARGEYRDNGHEALNKFLAPTLGYLVYQEEVIEFLHSFCGYTMGEADIVRRGFAKKTGTEKFIPQIKAGFTKTMKEKYGVDEEESDRLIVNFIKVIEDASSYLFSKNHADPYSWIGYICGYLRYHYPIEFITTALNIFEDNNEKSLAITDYALRHGIKISPIKFRHSIAQYSFSKETNEIYKGISSIKYMNAAVANEMYALRDRQYESFVDLLKDLNTETSLDSRQLKILINLDFFSEFGDANYLLKLSEIFDSFSDKQLRKEKLDALGIDLDVVRPLCGSETDKMFTQFDKTTVIKEIGRHIRYTKRTLRQELEAQAEYLGYLTTSGEQYRGIGMVMEVDTKYSPKLKVYSLKQGETIDCKIDKKTFNKMKLKERDIIKIQGQTRKPKVKKNDAGEWEPIPGVNEIWITKYQKVENI